MERRPEGVAVLLSIVLVAKLAGATGFKLTGNIGNMMTDGDYYFHLLCL